MAHEDRGRKGLSPQLVPLAVQGQKFFFVVNAVYLKHVIPLACRLSHTATHAPAELSNKLIQAGMAPFPTVRLSHTVSGLLGDPSSKLAVLKQRDDMRSKGRGRIADQDLLRICDLDSLDRGGGGYDRNTHRHCFKHLVLNSACDAQGRDADLRAHDMRAQVIYFS